jgi:alpha-tubulin suppressor-like RCC1 family protein
MNSITVGEKLSAIIDEDNQLYTWGGQDIAKCEEFKS